MFTLKHSVNRVTLALTTAAFALHFSVANAVPFSSDITINGSSSFDEGSSYGGTGEFGIVAGGTTTASSYAADSTVAGSDPVSGSLTAINDGVGFSGSAFANDDYFSTGINSSLSLSNNSLSDSFEVVFKLSYSNMVNADGADAFSRSLLTVGLDIPFTPEFFFSELSSDTKFGDLDSSGDLSTFGASLTESGDEFFSFILDPTSTLGLNMNWALDGEDFATGGPLLLSTSVNPIVDAEAEVSAFLSIYSIDQVKAPIPSTFILVAIGMILLPLQRWLRAFVNG